MYVPGTPPEGAYQPGSGFGHEWHNVDVEDAKAALTLPLDDVFGGWIGMLGDVLNGILSSVVNGIVAGAELVGMVVSGVIDTVTAAIEWVSDGIASLFGAGSGTPAFTVGSSLADAYDKQQDLIGKVDDLMIDNAGFINLCMSKNAAINWTEDSWLVCNFDKDITQHKNAERNQIIIDGSMDSNLMTNYPGNKAAGYGIEFLAPGVWILDGQLTFSPGPTVTAYRYIEMEIRVFRLNSQSAYAIAEEHYTTTRVATGTITSRYATTPIHKAVIIPDDGERYAAVMTARYQTDRQWNIMGGALWTSFSAVRESVDTTDYGAQDAAIGTTNYSN